MAANVNMKRTLINSISLLVAIAILGSCALITPATKPKSSLAHLSIGMHKTEIISLLGKPDEIRGSQINSDGDRVIVWQYTLYDVAKATRNNFVWGLLTFRFFWLVPIGTTGEDYYWLFLIDDRLVQWGRAGDWPD